MVLPAVIVVLLHHSAVDTGTDSSVVRMGKRGIGGYACSYCSTVTSHCCVYSNWPQCC